MPRSSSASATRALVVVVAWHNASTAAALRSALSPGEGVAAPQAEAAVGTGKASTEVADGLAAAFRTVTYPASAYAPETGGPITGTFRSMLSEGAATPQSPATMGRRKAAKDVAEGPLIAIATWTPQRLGAVIAARVNKEGSVLISAVGPAATYLTFKSMIAAAKRLKGDYVGNVLAAAAFKQALSLRTGIDTLGYLFVVRPVPAMRRMESPDTVTEGDRSAHVLAGFMAGRLLDRKIVTVAAMGAKAVHSILKSATIAEAILVQTQEASELKLAIVPRLAPFDAGGNQTMYRMHLTCVFADR